MSFCRRGMVVMPLKATPDTVQGCSYHIIGPIQETGGPAWNPLALHGKSTIFVAVAGMPQDGILGIDQPGGAGPGRSGTAMD